jgi:hypothetical protein
MGCASCGSNTIAPVRTPVRAGLSLPDYSSDCNYTMSQLQAWLVLLICCKDKALYPQIGLTGPQLNSYLGIVMSALNYVSYPCNFASKLDIISDVIILIQNLGAC